MRTRTFAAVALVVAAAGLVGSGAWALGRGSTPGYGWMHSRSTAWMMGWQSGSAQPVTTIAEARARAQSFADRLGLRVGEVMRFTDNFYARLDDGSGKPATEVLVDPATGRTSLEYGPAMMWNTRYGMPSGRFAWPRGATTTPYGGMMGGGYGGMMGRYGGMMGGGYGGMMGRYGGPTWTPPSGSVTAPLSAKEAIAVADRWLAQTDPTLDVPDADAFPGYYTMETERRGTIVGMLSVNATTGAVWNHWWHGTFVASE